MTVCPECGAEFDTVAQAKDLPLQALRQQCPDCDYTVEVSIINYAVSFEVVAPALPDDTCSENCDRGAMARSKRVGEGVEGKCARHLGAHREAALDLRNEL